MGFVHLHVHTKYSLLDGANKPEALIAKVKTAGMPAVAITDHGNMFGAVEFYQKAAAEGIKPILGCEMYVAPKSRKDKGGRADDYEAGGNHREASPPAPTISRINELDTNASAGSVSTNTVSIAGAMPRFACAMGASKPRSIASRSPRRIATAPS